MRRGGPPRCNDCKGPHARYLEIDGAYVWLCVDCEYDRRYALEARCMGPGWIDHEPAPLQRERLF